MWPFQGITFLKWIKIKFEHRHLLYCLNSQPGWVTLALGTIILNFWTWMHLNYSLHEWKVGKRKVSHVKARYTNSCKREYDLVSVRELYSILNSQNRLKYQLWHNVRLTQKKKYWVLLLPGAYVYPKCLFFCHNSLLGLILRGKNTLPRNGKLEYVFFKKHLKQLYSINKN